MRGPPLDHCPAQPEEDPAVAAEALEVGMPRRAVLAVVVDGMSDAERGQGLFVEGDRAVEVADGDEDVVEHGASPEPERA
jgi:hypothetical protein